MRITSLEIHNFKTLDHLVWDQIPETGVFVIHGDNEQGKSTILEALHQVLFIKHNSRASQVRASQPLGKDVAPEVSITMAFGDTTCSLRKKWLRGAQAELKISGEQPYTGAQAEERFTEFFAQHLDISLFHVLFNKQGGLTTTLGMSEIMPLRAALDSHLGETTDNHVAESTEIMARVEAEYAQYYSLKTHRPTKLLTTMRVDLEAAEKTYTEKTAKLGTLEDHVNQIERISRDLARDKEQLPKAQQTVDNCLAELAAAEAVAQKAEAADKELELAQQKAELKTNQLQQRQTLTMRWKQATERLAELATELNQLRKQAESEQQDAHVLQQKHTAALAAEQEAREELRLATELVAQVAATTQRQELARTLNAVEEIDEQLGALTQTPKVTEETIQSLQDAEQEILIAQHALRLKSTKLIITATTPTEIQIDQQTITAEAHALERDITAATSVTIGAVTARLEPSAGASESAVTLTAAKQRLKQLKERSGFDSAKAARRGGEKYRAAQQQIQHLASQRTEALGETTLEQVRAELEQDFVPATVDAATARQRQETAEAQFDQAQKDRAFIGEQLTRIQDRPLQRDLIAKDAVHKQAQESVAELQQELDGAELVLPLKKLEAEVTATEAVVRQAQGRRQAMAAELAEVDVETKRQLAKAAQATVKAIAHRIASADVDIAAQQSYIDAYAGAAEERDQAHAQFIIAKRKAGELEQRAAAAKLLYEVMVAQQQAAHEKYAQPLVAELARLSRPIFGSQVGYCLSDSLEVVQRVGSQGAVFDVAALSGGAQEQLAILIRFAIASLVSAYDQAVPVFLDDALGSSDPARLLAMGAVFNELGKHRQIFVLTCVPNRYESVTDRIDMPIQKMLFPSHL